MKYVELKDFSIRTGNVRSLYRAGHLTTVISSLERYQLNIAAIQETRWPGQGNLKTNNWTYFYSGGLDHQAGDKNEAIKNEFYEKLDTVCDLLPNSKVKILLGDFNAKIGQEPIFSPTIGSNSLHLNSNDNGTRLINFAMARDMVVSSNTFPHKNIHKQTWVSPDGRTRNQIDHIVVDDRFKRCILDVRSMRCSSGISDHFMVKTKVRLRLSIKWKERRAPVKKINIEPLKYSQTTEQYKNRLNDILWPTEKASSIDEMWEKTEKSVKKIAEEVLGYQRKRAINKWFNEECRTAMVERDDKRAKQIIRKNKRMWEKTRIETIENSYKSNTKLFFEKANEVKNGFKPRSTIMKDDQGTLITDKEEVTREFKKVFEQMLNISTETEAEDNNIITVEKYLEEPTLEEVKMAVEMLKGGKGPGEDTIIAELLKKG
ncbi:hypothetical protein QTP88_004211 [Uroleucon formosanum]